MKYFWLQMKTKRTLLQWTGHLIGVMFAIIVSLIPTGIYAVVWWFIPKTFWPILGTALGGIVWFVAQIVWALCVALEWDDLNDDLTLAPPPAEGDGDLDISL